MDYGMIGKIEKAKFYAEERDQRVQFQSLQASVLGDNDSTHQVKYDGGQWQCSFNYFGSHQVSSISSTEVKKMMAMVEMGVPA